MPRYIECSHIEKDLEERYNYYRKESEIKVGNRFAIDKEMQTAAIIAKHCLDQIKEAPAADVVEVRHGEWTVKDLNNSLYESKKAPHCSVCDYMSFIKYGYCPNCGAKMDG